LLIPPLEFVIYYAGGIVLLIVVLFWRRPRRGMRLRLGGGRRATDYKNQALRGRISPDDPSPSENERSLNVVFNYNGETWDAFEVFGLPAGSGMEVVEAAYHEALEKNEPSARPFLGAAFKAIAESAADRRKSS
jgi:hypothetical protein